jgi:MFS family permease
VKVLGASVDPLRERPFRLLFFGRTLSAIGDAIVPVALTFAVLDLGGATDLGIVLGSYSAARVVFLLAGGVWADRLPRQLVMMAADLVRAGVQALIAMAFFTDAIQVWQLAVGSAVFGAAAAFFNPASTGLVPQLVSSDRLQEANALLGLTRSGVEVLGPAVSGIIVSTLGFGIVFAVDAVSFVASFLCLAAMRVPRAIQPREHKTMLMDVLEGFRIVRERRWIVVGLSCDVVFNLALACYFVLGPVVFEEHFDGARDWGLLMTAASVGGVFGSLIALRFKPARPMFVAYVVAFVTPMQLIELAPPLPLALLLVGAPLVVVAIVLVNTYWATMEQQHVPGEYLSRVDALGWMISLIVMPVGMVVVGPLSSIIGVETTLIVFALLAAAALVGALSVRDFRELRRIEDEPGAANDQVVTPPESAPAR